MKWSLIKTNDKYLAWLRKTPYNVYNILEGGIRSGKTTFLILAYCKYLETLTEDGLHVAAAPTIGSAKTILLNGGDGLGIKNYFGSRATEKQFDKKDALYIKIGKHTQVVIFVGSSLSNSWESIHGYTIKSAILTEANLGHRTFVQQVMQRTILNKGSRKLFMDLNPMGEKHWFYTEFLDVWAQKSKEGDFTSGLNYTTVSLYDNPVITEKIIQDTLSEYDTDSNIYKSRILGMRVNDADLIYKVYDWNIIKRVDLPRIQEWSIAVDIGVTASATTIVAIGVADQALYNIKDYRHKNGTGKTNLLKADFKETYDYCVDVVNFYKELYEQIGFAPKAIFIDKDPTFYRILHKTFLEYGLPANLIAYAIKDKVTERITLVNNLLYRKKYFLVEDVKDSIYCLQNATYDKKAFESRGVLQRLDDTSLEYNVVDGLDPQEYIITYYAKRFNL